jgi:hypothetical protein
MKPYGFVTYRKLTDFIVFSFVSHFPSLGKNTLAYYGICTLQIRNALIVQAPGASGGGQTRTLDLGKVR